MSVMLIRILSSSLSSHICRHWRKRNSIRKRLNISLLWMKGNGLTTACLKLRNQRTKRWKHIIWRRDERRILWRSSWAEHFVVWIAQLQNLLCPDVVFSGKHFETVIEKITFNSQNRQKSCFTCTIWKF